MHPVISAQRQKEEATEVSELQKTIKKLQENLNKCPEGEMFEEVRKKIKNELKSKEKELLQKQSGTETAAALDVEFTQSQLM